MINFLTYGVSIFGFFAVFLSFISEHRCFIREAGTRYAYRVGYEFTAEILDKLSCYFYWSFLSWPVCFIVLMVGIVIFLRGHDAPPVKVFGFFVGLIVLMILITKLVIVKDGHSYLVGGT